MLLPLFLSLPPQRRDRHRHQGRHHFTQAGSASISGTVFTRTCGRDSQFCRKVPVVLDVMSAEMRKTAWQKG